MIASFGELTPIGHGAFAHVYRGYDETFNRDVAIKILDQSSFGDDVLRRFERECRAIGAVSAHPKIVTVYSSGTMSAGAPYIVMDLMNGSLSDVLAREGSLPWADVVAIGGDIAGAVQAAHDEGILHRDIKPDNILVSRYGHAQLGDFGISSIFDTTVGAREAVTASVAHAAPEVLEGRRATPASDIYSLASTMVAMIRGRAPFSETDDEKLAVVIARIRRDAPPRLAGYGVPEELQAILDRAMAKNPTDRYFSAVDFGDALTAFRPRLADTRGLLLGTRRESTPPTASGGAASDAPAASPVGGGPSRPGLNRPAGLIPGGSLIPGGLLKGGSLIPPADAAVPAQAEPIGGSNRIPIGPTRAGLIPSGPLDEPRSDGASVEILRPDTALPSNLESGELTPVVATPVEVVPVDDETEVTDAEIVEPEVVEAGFSEAGVVSSRPGANVVPVITLRDNPVLDPDDPLLRIHPEADGDEPRDRRRRRRLFAGLAVVVGLGAAGGAAVALSGSHHSKHPTTPAAAVPTSGSVGNQVALPSPSFTSSCVGWDCTFTASAAILPSGATLRWTFPDGSSAVGPTARHTFTADGTQTVKLAVADGSRTGAPSSSVVTLMSWRPNLAISTAGSTAHPKITLAATSTQSKCLTGSVQLQDQQGRSWHTVTTVALPSSGKVSAAAPKSGGYRWSLPASSQPSGRCLAGTSRTATVTIATPPATGTTTTTTTTTNPPPASTGGSDSGSGADPRNNAPVPPGG